MPRLEMCRSGELLDVKECLKKCTSEIYLQLGTFDTGLRAIGFNSDCTSITAFRSHDCVITKSIEKTDLPIPNCAKCYKDLVAAIYVLICQKVPSFDRIDRYPVAVTYDIMKRRTGLIYVTGLDSPVEYEYGFMGDEIYER